MDYVLPSNLEDLIHHSKNNAACGRIASCFDDIASQLDEFGVPEEFEIAALDLSGSDSLRGVNEAGVEVVAFFHKDFDAIVVLGRDGSIDTLADWEGLIEAEGNNENGTATYEQFYEIARGSEAFDLPAYNAIPGDDEGLDDDESEDEQE